MLRACLWPTEDEESYEAAATPVSRASHMPLAAPRPRLPSFHNAPIVRSSARLPLESSSEPRGPGGGLMPGVQSEGKECGQIHVDLGSWRSLENEILELEAHRCRGSGCLDWKDGPVPKSCLSSVHFFTMKLCLFYSTYPDTFLVFQ